MFKLDIRILVVDDMASMRKLVIKACKEIGFIHFIEAENGSKGWETIQNSTPPVDLIISDWDMPQCNGLDLLKRLRSDRRFSEVPFIILNTETEAEQVVEALRAGIDGFVVKPCSVKVLTKTLEAAYQKRSTPAASR